ncbi:unnamed protein product [Tuber aestivum]|uniref:RPEL repeat protein n=1 Tax=Tuber aestivum TaxID=59557 RepID=A0A292PZ71_9PEZI|nr:unnamed protein product [Tuber aestivum]
MADTAATDTLAASPIKERQNSLENALAHRPDQKELEERNILHPRAEISERQQELAKAMAHRPGKDDLVQPPALIAHQRELEKNMLERDLKVLLPLYHRRSLSLQFANNLQEKLSHRPEPQEVIQKGILRRPSLNHTADEDPTNPCE